MFDHIKVDPRYLILPEDQGSLQNHDWSKEMFKTKDGHNVSGQYEIKRKRLYFTEPVAGDTGIVRDINRIMFYGNIPKPRHDYHFAWSAVFDNGRLQSIDLTNWEVKDNSERARIDAEIAKKIVAGRVRSTKVWYKCYKYLWRGPVKWTALLGLRCLYKLADFITWLERKVLPW